MRLFIVCEGLKWTHLPVGGGLYDQHPKLLDDWQFIFQRRAEYERQKEAREGRQNKNKRRSRGL